MEGFPMTSKRLCVLAVTGGMIVLGACNKAGTSYGNNSATAETKTTTATGDPIASAESAAPAAIAHSASVVTIDAKGAMTTVRNGTNGWTCMPDAPDTP